MLIVGCLFARVFTGEHSSVEPMYHGHCLGYWMKRYYQAGMLGRQYEYERRESAQRAVRAAGTNAVPTLLRWMQAEGRPLRRAFDSQWGCLRFTDNDSLHAMAWWGFEFLGDQARSAAPAIIAAMKVSSAESRLSELDCLLRIAPDDAVLLPVLRNLLSDPSYLVQREAAAALLMNYPAETASVYRRFPELRLSHGESTNLAPSLRSPTGGRVGGPAPDASRRP